MSALMVFTITPFFIIRNAEKQKFVVFFPDSRLKQNVFTAGFRFTEKRL